MNLLIQELSEASFAPFGKVIAQPERAEDASGPGWTWWGENAHLAGDARPYGIGFLDLSPAPLAFDWAERHMHSQEMIIPAGGDCLVYVGPADFPEEPGRLPPLERFQVFRVREGQGVILEPGVWHGAPLAVEKPLKVIVLLHQNTGREDAYVVRFPDTPLRIGEGE